MKDIRDIILATDDERELIERYAESDVRDIALKLRRTETVRPDYVARQIEGKQTMMQKMPLMGRTEGIVYPQHISLEQCSSEQTARYKSELIEGDSLADLTGGLGVDFCIMARRFRSATYVERNEELAAIVEHNLPLLGLGEAKVVCGDGTEYLYNIGKKTSCIYLDPARRDQYGGKTVRLSDCTPDLAAIQDQLKEKAETVMAKLSPMLDIKDALGELREVREMHIVSVDNECKEMLVVMQKGYAEEPEITAVNIGKNGQQRFTFKMSEEQNAECAIAEEIGKYIYEPNTALMKAGAYRLLTERYGVKKLHPNTHVYTSDEMVEDFPGRRFQVMSTGSLTKGNRPETLKDVKKGNISARNFPMKPEEIKRQLKMSDGGENYIFAVTARGDKKIIIDCRKA